MMAGYALGSIYELAGEVRRRYLLFIGIAACVLFVVIRFINIYGDPQPWAQQASAMFTFLSFLNTTKYPPSLLFLLMTLGPSMIVLSLAWVGFAYVGYPLLLALLARFSPRPVQRADIAPPISVTSR